MKLSGLNGGLSGRIEDDNICIRAGRKRSLPGEEAEELGGIRREHFHELIYVDAPLVDSLGVHERQQCFNAWQTSGDSAEIILVGVFLGAAERAVVCGDYLDGAHSQAAPEHLVIYRFSEWRAAWELMAFGTAVFVFCKEEIVWTCLGKDSHPFSLGFPR